MTSRSCFPGLLKNDIIELDLAALDTFFHRNRNGEFILRPRRGRDAAQAHESLHAQGILVQGEDPCDIQTILEELRALVCAKIMFLFRQSHFNIRHAIATQTSPHLQLRVFPA